MSGCIRQEMRQQQRLGLMIALIALMAAMAFFVSFQVACGDDDDDDDDTYGDDDSSDDDDADDDDDDDVSDDDADDDDDIAVDQEISINSFTMDPSPVNLTIGAVVRWTNDDSVPHTVTSGQRDDVDAGSEFDSGTLSPGDTFIHTFNSEGAFEYHCQVHSSMNGFFVNVGVK